MLVNKNGEVSLIEIINVIADSKKYIVLLAILGAVAGLGIAQLQPSKYQAEIKVVGVQSNSSSSGLNLPSSLSSLGLGRSQDNNLVLALEMIKTVRLAQRLDDKYKLLEILFGEKWRRENGGWVRQPATGVLAPLKEMVRQWIGRSPSVVGLAGVLAAEVTVRTEKETGIVTISFQHPDPKFAVNLLKWVVAESDSLLREDNIRKTEDRIAFTQKELDTLQVQDVRRNLLEVLSGEMKNRIFLESGAPFALQVMDGPVATERPVSPKPAVNFAIGFGLGAVLGIVFAFGRQIRRDFRAYTGQLAER